MHDRIRVEGAIDKLKLARKYGSQFYENLSDDEWFWSPTGYTTHVAWQVGHMAVSEYNLCIRRVRGRQSGDEMLVSDEHLALFGLGSVPVADRTKYPSREKIMWLLRDVRDEVLEVLAKRSDADLDVPLEQPHPVFQTKLGAVEYSSLHECIHVGQIGMLRRLMGKSAIR